MTNTFFQKSTLTIVLATAFAALSGCAGGGGGGKDDYDQYFPTRPGDPSVVKPIIPPKDLQPEPNNPDPSLSYESSFNRQGINNVIAQGYTGKNVDVGVLDTGYVGGNGANVVSQKRYYGTEAEKLPDGSYQLRTDESFATHGTAVADLIGGKAPDGLDNLQYPGGVAKDVRIHSGDIGVTSNIVSQNAIAAGIKEMSSNNVKIINLSSNTPSHTEGTTPNVGFAFDKEATDAINNGVLIVVSNGNENKDNPGSTSYLPMVDPQTQKGLITVGGVDMTSNGTPITPTTQVFDGGYNKCGSAAQWCMVATGTNPVGDSYFSGTSSSAPLVTGVAAQIKQKYPWADNDFLRTSLLTTAEDIGAAGVDAIFGWGLLDANKAINGPASLPFGQLNLDVSAGTYELSNDISGSYGFNKSGVGTIDLTGNNTFTGNSVVSSGVYKVSGSVVNPTVIIGGSVSGSGSFSNIVNISGVVSAVESDIKVKGDFTQASTGILDVAYGNKLDVSGIALLDGTLKVDKTAEGYVSKDNPTETVVEASAIVGTFATLDIGNILVNSTVSYSPTSIELSATRVDVTQAASAASTAGHKVSQAGARNLEQLYSALDSGSVADIQAKAMAVSIQQDTKTQEQLASTTKSLDATVYGNSVASTQLQINQAAKVFSEHMSNEGAFISYEGGRGELASGEAKTDLDSVLIGNVFRLNPDWSVGLTFVAQNSMLEQMYGKSKTDVYGGMVAFQYGKAEDGFVRSTFGAHSFDSEIHRTVQIGDDKHGLKSDMDGTILTADITAGREFELFSNYDSKMTIQPSAGITFAHTRVGSFAEKGISAPGFDFDNVSFNRSTAHAEIDAAYQFTAGAMPMSLNGYTGITRDLSNTNKSFEGTFSNTGVAIETSGRDVPKTRGNVGLGLKMSVSDMVAISARYDRQFGSGYHHNYFNGNISIVW